MSFNERIKELAALKVMDLQSTQIRHLLTVKNIWLSVIGIIIGTPLGNISLNAMMNSNGENFDMGDLTFEEFVEKYNELTAEQLEVWSDIWGVEYYSKRIEKKLKSPLDIGIYECYILYKFNRLNR